MPTTARRLWTAIVRAAPALLASGVLWSFGLAAGAAVAAASAGVVVAIGVALPRTAVELDVFTVRFGRSVRRASSYAVSVAVWTILVLPSWGLSRLVGHSPLEPGWASRSSAWVDIEPTRNRTPDHRPATPGRFGARDLRPASSVRRRSAMRLVVVGASAGVVLATWFLTTAKDEPAVAGIDLRGGRAPSDDETRTPITVGPDQGEPVSWNGFPLTDYAHEDEPWARQHIRELSAAGSNPDLIVGSRNRNFAGSTLNVREGRRVTYTPEEADVTVWYFGGSTMYGIGQRDDQTIPSVVAHLAELDGTRIRSLNFGVSGYVNWQETIRFAEALQSDLPRPDLVVFYDGANDQGLGYERVDDGSLDPDVSERLTFSETERAAHRRALGDRDPIADPLERATTAIQLAAGQYRRGVETARLLGAGSGIPVVHFWQPQPFAKVASPADDELYRRVAFDPGLLPASTAAYASIREASGVDPFDLSTALDDVAVPVYFDPSHTNELGARIVATELYRLLRPRLDRIEAGS